MLVLGRQENQSIQIGDNIVIHFLRIRKQHGKPADVRVGIDAPKEIKIFRSELIDEPQRPAGECPQDAPGPDA